MSAEPPETAAALLDAASQAFAEGFGAILEIVPTDGPPFHVDGRGPTALVRAGRPDAPAQCAWSAPLDDLRRIFEGGRALESAFLSGRLKIGGDMSVMARLKLQSLR